MNDTDAEKIKDEAAEEINAADAAILEVGDVNEAKANRFYDRLRKSINLYLAKKREGKSSRAAEFLFLVPDIFMLLWRLANDRRVNMKNKVLLGSGIAYFIFPLDVLPEALLGPLGYADDLVFAVYILNRMLIDTDEAVLRQHWSGDVDLLDAIRRVLHSADELVASDFLKQIKKLVK